MYISARICCRECCSVLDNSKDHQADALHALSSRRSLEAGKCHHDSRLLQAHRVCCGRYRQPGFAWRGWWGQVDHCLWCTGTALLLQRNHVGNLHFASYPFGISCALGVTSWSAGHDCMELYGKQNWVPPDEVNSWSSLGVYLFSLADCRFYGATSSRWRALKYNLQDTNWA